MMAEIIGYFVLIMMTVSIFSFGTVSVWGMFEETQVGKIVVKKLKKMLEEENERL